MCFGIPFRAMMIGMWKPYLNFFRLPWRSKRLALQCALILPFTYAGLKLLGFKTFLKVIEHLTSVAPKSSEYSEEQARRDTQLFSAVTRRIPLPLKCLGRSLALCWLLRWHGADAEIHIGVRKSNQGLDAHAWVQIGDLVINDSEDVTERYTGLSLSYSDRGSI